MKPVDPRSASPGVFLASDLARDATGVVPHVDGGTHAAGIGALTRPAAHE